MAQITGSSTIDWSGISLAQVDFETDFLEFVNRLDDIFNELVPPPPLLPPPPIFVTPTVLLVDLGSGGSLSFRGSGFFGTSPLVINSFNYINTGTGEVVRWTGTFNGGNERITTATLESTGFSESFKGNIIIPATFPDAGNITGTLTSLVVKIGSATGTFSGNFSLTGDFVSASLTGTVTGISVVSGDNTITMTGLSLSLDVLEAALASGDLATVNDLFSVVGNQLTGNDVITYTNNSGVGMTFYGGPGNDTITISGPNADMLIGGAGDDIYIHDGVADTIVENPGEGSDTIRAAVSFTLPDAAQNIENLTLTGTGNIDGTGNATGNILTGNSGNNVLSGGAGNDAMSGGLGNDTYTVDSAGDVATEALNAGIDLVQSSAASYTLGANVENLELTGSDDLNGTGNTRANVLTGNSGVNILTGGAGNDTYIVQNDADSVVENLIAGIDLVQSTAANFTLGANVENLTLLGGTDINGTGNALNNILTGNNGVNQLTGNAGNDTLNGGADDDALDGGAGNDVILIGNAADHGVGEVIDGGTGVDVIRFTSTTADETLVLNEDVTGVERVVIGTATGLTTGTTALNVDAAAVGTGLSLLGNAGANALFGTGSNDVLNGGGGDDTLLGGAGNDTLIGGTGNDTLDGEADTNTLIGGTGNDTFIVDSLTNVVREGLNAGTDTVVAALTYTLGANVENLTLTGSADRNGTGNTRANVLTGNDGSNVLAGGVGNDTLIGGVLQDTVTGGTGNDRVVMQVTVGDVDEADGGAGRDTLALVGAVDGDNVVVVDLSSATDQVVSIGGVSDDTLAQINFENLDASGLGSSVTVTGSVGANTIIGSSGVDNINGGAGNDTLNGGADDDTLDGGAGNDVILIGNAADHGVGEVIDGGTGVDVIRFTSTTADETLVLNEDVTGVERVVIGTATGLTTGTTALNVDAAAVGTGLSLLGNAGANALFGTGSNDVLNGGGGDDTLLGGAGNDTLIGGTGNDTLDGEADTNTLIGGTGNDTFIVDSLTNVVREGLNAGTDTVVAALTYTLGANVENLALTGSDDLNGTGNTRANVLTGNDGSNVLNGGVGNDTLIGGVGQDTVTGGTGNDRIVMQVTAGDVDVDVADGGAGIDTLALVGTVDGDGVVVVDLSSTIDQVTRIGTVDPESLVQKNFENLDASELGSSVTVTGSAGANIIIGSIGADIINSGVGNDMLNGGADDDAMDGGAGNDTYVVSSLGDTVTEMLAGAAGGTDLVLSAADFTLGANVENLTLLGGTDINGTGNALNNILTGNSGNNQLFGGAGNDMLIGGAGSDSLDGGAGADKMTGGLGDDTYTVDLVTDVVTEALNAGIDTVVAELTYTLGANVEDLELTGLALNGTGNALNNVIVGNSGHNVLSGLAGTDVLIGRDGNDTLLGGLGRDTVTGGTGDDQITMLVTAGNVDTIDAGDDTDTLVLSGVVPGNHMVVVDLSSATDQVVSIGGVLDDTLAQINFENLNASGIGSSVTVTGSDGDNSIIGSNGNDSIDGGAGNDTLSGLAGNDTFLFSLSDGQDLVLDNSGSADKMLFDSGIDPLDLVISRQANDLRLAIHGSSDQITVQNWYTSSVNRTETIQAGNGQTLLSTQVDQLIQAMAQFTAQTGLTWDLAIDQRPQDVQAVLAASWQ
jgi:trimeric autotransporter adhesin